MAAPHTLQQEVFRQQALNLGNSTRFERDFSAYLNLPWLWLDLMYEITVAQGATPATSPAADGLLQLIHAVWFRTEDGEAPYDGIPGRMINLEGQIKMGGQGPAYDAIVTEGANNSTIFRVMQRLWFADPLAKSLMDYLFDAQAYKSVKLEVMLGNILDLYGVGNTAAITSALLTCKVTMLDEPLENFLPSTQWPKAFQERGVNVPVDPSAISYIDQLSDYNLWLMRLFAYQSTATIVGQPFSGPADTAHISDISLKDASGYPVKSILASMLTRDNQLHYNFPALLPGWQVLEMMNGNHGPSAYFSGGKNPRFLWTNAVNPPAGTQVSLGYQGYRNYAKPEKHQAGASNRQVGLAV